MKKGSIIYIDEDSDDIDLFQQFVGDSFQLSVLQIENDDELESIVDEVMSSGVDAVITDFLLNEKVRVKFDGQALIEAIQSRNKHIPCFLLTSHAPDAINATHDARLVQSKGVPFGGNDHKDLQTLFLAQIEKVIINFKSNYSNAANELDSLNAIPTENLTALQKQRIIDLDNFIDSHGFTSSPIPSELKETKSLELLTELVKNIDELISREK